MRIDSKVLFGSALIVLAPFALAKTASLTAPTVPNELRLPDGLKLEQTFNADGVQIYACQAKADSGFEWAFKAPEATLSAEDGTKTGTHYAGPTWEANDGSKLVGEVKARLNSSDPNAIPWLLLATKSTGKDGTLAKVAFIHRLETVGGKAPNSECNTGTVGTQARVPYTAKYYFYAARN
jgi:hypothetical protein